MTDSGSEARFREMIAMLRAQNRRYRELIQNLSSTNKILRTRLKETQQSPPELRAFESFGRSQRPTPVRATEKPAQKRPIHPSGQGPEHETGVELKSLAPTPGWKCLAVDQPQIRIGFLLFGMTRENAEEAVEVVEQRQVRSRDFTPVFVTDIADLAPFRERGYVVEYVPPSITSQGKKNQAHHHDLQARLEFIEEKWDLDNLVDLGRHPQTSET